MLGPSTVIIARWCTTVKPIETNGRLVEADGCGIAHLVRPFASARILALGPSDNNAALLIDLHALNPESYGFQLALLLSDLYIDVLSSLIDRCCKLRIVLAWVLEVHNENTLDSSRYNLILLVVKVDEINRREHTHVFNGDRHIVAVFIKEDELELRRYHKVEAVFVRKCNCRDSAVRPCDVYHFLMINLCTRFHGPYVQWLCIPCCVYSTKGIGD